MLKFSNIIVISFVFTTFTPSSYALDAFDDFGLEKALRQKILPQKQNKGELPFEKPTLIKKEDPVEFLKKPKDKPSLPLLPPAPEIMKKIQMIP